MDDPPIPPEEDTERAEEARFTVDSHIFRELGELLVGRDSTALAELIKNSYDADATRVIVHGERIRDVAGSRIIVTDDGTGMTLAEFRNGFLRIASRGKSVGDRRSRRFGRRYTGEKGIGRLAAHKLARRIQVHSIPWMPATYADRGVAASIDWDRLEHHRSLEETGDGMSLATFPIASGASAGTQIDLSSLRRPWSGEDLSRFLGEASSFEPFPILRGVLPPEMLSGRLLFSAPVIRDAKNVDPGFAVEFSGDFEIDADMWDEVVHSVDWIVEIHSTKQHIRYAIAPSLREREQRGGQSSTYTVPQPEPKTGPFFDARLFVRERGRASNIFRVWSREVSGIRLFMEGFRVLPYGEPGNDWLNLDRDYAARSRAFAAIEGMEALADPSVDARAGLTALPNENFIGAVFLRDRDAPLLEMLVNREGFVPNRSYSLLRDQIRAGAHLLLRARGAARVAERGARSDARRRLPGSSPRALDETPLAVRRREELRANVAQAQASVADARNAFQSGAYSEAESAIGLLEESLTGLTSSLSEFIEEQGLLPVLASLGIQMAQFTHEINGLVGLSQSADRVLDRMRGESALPRSIRRELSEVRLVVSELRSRLERQASYLVDVIAPDARRRRSRAMLAARFDSAARLVASSAADRRIRIVNEIPPDLKSPLMYPAELTAVFANLISNAVKAAGAGGRVLASGWREEDGTVIVEIENTGVAVDVSKSERWFRPFESTTTEVDPALGHGMGLGLPISRAILEEYRASLEFVAPGVGYSSALRIVFRPS